MIRLFFAILALVFAISVPLLGWIGWLIFALICLSFSDES